MLACSGLTDQWHDDGGTGAAPDGLFDLPAGVEGDHRLDERIAGPHVHNAITTGGQVHVVDVRRFLQRPDRAQVRRRLGRVLDRLVVRARIHHAVQCANQVHVLVQSQQRGRTARRRRPSIRFAIVVRPLTMVDAVPGAAILIAGQAHDRLLLKRVAQVPVKSDPTGETASHLNDVASTTSELTLLMTQISPLVRVSPGLPVVLMADVLQKSPLVRGPETSLVKKLGGRGMCKIVNSELNSVVTTRETKNHHRRYPVPREQPAAR